MTIERYVNANALADELIDKAAGYMINANMHDKLSMDTSLSAHAVDTHKRLTQHYLSMCQALEDIIPELSGKTRYDVMDEISVRAETASAGAPRETGSL